MGGWLPGHPQMADRAKPTPRGEWPNLPDMWEQGLLSHPHYMNTATTEGWKVEQFPARANSLRMP